MLRKHGGLVGSYTGDAAFIQRYCDSIQLVKEDNLEYIKLTSPFIASKLKDETRIKMYELAWSLLFGEEDKIDKTEEDKKVLKEIREQFKHMKTHGAKEITSDHGEQFLETFKNQL